MKLSYLAALVVASTVVGQVTFQSGLDSSKCLDNSNQLQIPGNPTVLFTCNGGFAQQWVVNTTESAIHLFANQSFCLDGGTNAPPAPGSHVAINTCNTSSPTQRFVPTLFGKLIELCPTGLCIGVPNDTDIDLTGLQLELCDMSDPGQVWNPA